MSFIAATAGAGLMTFLGVHELTGDWITSSAFGLAVINGIFALINGVRQ